jgi:ferredoxin-NADP reductase
MQLFRIAHIIPETKDAKTFMLQPTKQEEQLSYKAGQFITLVFDTKFGEKRRSYSISSSPDLNEPFSITIKKVENGEFSRLLIAHAKEGDILNSSGISGFFQLPDKTDYIDQFFFLAAGSGITPCYAIIKTLLATTKMQIVLIYSNRKESDTIFYNQLQSLQHQHQQQLQIHFLFSHYNDVHRSRLSNWLLQHLLKTYLLTKKQKAMFYLCGPFDYMQMVNITLLIEGISPANIRKENFNALPRKEKPAPPDKDAHTVIIQFENKIHQVTVQYPFSILAAAKAAKIDIPYSCEAGRCGSCVATCIKGKIWMAYNEVLMDDEIAKGSILCCQAYPVEGDAEIVV